MFLIIILACPIAEYETMATVVFEDPIHHISGKISKKYRTTYNYRDTSNRKYTSVRGQRDLKNKPYTEKEQAQKTKFSTVGQAVRARMKDPSKINEDLAAFKAQTEYKTLYRFLWNLEWKKAQ